MTRTLIIISLFVCVLVMGFRVLKLEREVKSLGQYQLGLHREIGELEIRVEKFLPE